MDQTLEKWRLSHRTECIHRETAQRSVRFLVVGNAYVPSHHPVDSEESGQTASVESTSQPSRSLSV